MIDLHNITFSKSGEITCRTFKNETIILHQSNVEVLPRPNEETARQNLKQGYERFLKPKGVIGKQSFGFVRSFFTPKAKNNFEDFKTSWDFWKATERV